MLSANEEARQNEVLTAAWIIFHPLTAGLREARVHRAITVHTLLQEVHALLRELHTQGPHATSKPWRRHALASLA